MIKECLSPDFAGCELEQRGKRRRSNEHHLYWPKSRYVTPLEQAFRELPEHKVQLCICAHNELHEAMYPPPKPPVHEMIVACTVELVPCPEE